METNTPEKIYINSNLENRTWLIGKGDISFIEYTRTDAFIEKACKAFCKVCKMPNCNSKGCSYLKDFRNHVKGE